MRRSPLPTLVPDGAPAVARGRLPFPGLAAAVLAFAGVAALFGAVAWWQGAAARVPPSPDCIEFCGGAAGIQVMFAQSWVAVSVAWYLPWAAILRLGHHRTAQGVAMAQMVSAIVLPLLSGIAILLLWRAPGWVVAGQSVLMVGAFVLGAVVWHGIGSDPEVRKAGPFVGPSWWSALWQGTWLTGSTGRYRLAVAMAVMALGWAFVGIARLWAPRQDGTGIEFLAAVTQIGLALSLWRGRSRAGRVLALLAAGAAAYIGLGGMVSVAVFGGSLVLWIVHWVLIALGVGSALGIARPTPQQSSVTEPPPPS